MSLGAMLENIWTGADGGDWWWRENDNRSEKRWNVNKIFDRQEMLFSTWGGDDCLTVVCVCVCACKTNKV